MSHPRFVLNRRTGILHRLPTTEECNVDRVPRTQRRVFKSIKAAEGLYQHFCFHCLNREMVARR